MGNASLRDEVTKIFHVGIKMDGEEDDAASQEIRFGKNL